jgi:RNA polymerase sigma-70 factor (sigma-E family)
MSGRRPVLWGMDLLGRGRARAEFEGFAAADADGLLRVAFLMSGDRGEAEDLVQECLLRVARRWPRVRSMDHPGAFARRVLVNLAIDGGRRRRRRYSELQPSEPPASLDAEADSAAILEIRAELLCALGSLQPRQRAVLVLRYFLDLPESEVAAALDCSLGTVKSSASRGLERLRQMLDQTNPRASGERSVTTVSKEDQ